MLLLVLAIVLALLLSSAVVATVVLPICVHSDEFGLLLVSLELPSAAAHHSSPALRLLANSVAGALKLASISPVVFVPYSEACYQPWESMSSFEPEGRVLLLHVTNDGNGDFEHFYAS